MNLSDANLREVLGSSLEMLQRRPVLFLPKLLSSAVGALWFIGFLENYGSTVHYLVSMPFLIFMSVIVSVLVSSMVKGINEDREDLLRFGFGKLLERTSSLIITTIILLIVTFALSIPMSIGVFLYFTSGSIIALAAGFVCTIVLSLVFGFGIYFLPATLVSENSSLDAFKESFSSSNQNKGDVLKLTVFSFLLLLVASASSGVGETLGYVGFVVGRLISSVVSTYFYVVSPRYYFSS